MENEEHWPHTPLHRLDTGGVFIVTAATLYKSHVFQGSQRLDLLQTMLLSMAKQYGCQLEAWAVFPNHYHFVGRTTAPEPASDRC